MSLTCVWSFHSIRVLLTSERPLKESSEGTPTPCQIHTWSLQQQGHRYSSISINWPKWLPNLQNWSSIKGRHFNLEPEVQDGIMYLESWGASMEHVGRDPDPKWNHLKYFHARFRMTIVFPKGRIGEDLNVKGPWACPQIGAVTLWEIEWRCGSTSLHYLFLDHPPNGFMW